jgi:hypothetical protein
VQFGQAISIGYRKTFVGDSRLSGVGKTLAADR